jgi:hypothetical protein
MHVILLDRILVRLQHVFQSHGAGNTTVLPSYWVTLQFCQYCHSSYNYTALTTPAIQNSVWYLFPLKAIHQSFYVRHFQGCEQCGYRRSVFWCHSQTAKDKFWATIRHSTSRRNVQYSPYFIVVESCNNVIIAPTPIQAWSTHIVPHFMEIYILKQIQLHIVINSEKTIIIIIIITITRLYFIQWHTKAQNSKHYDVSAMSPSAG